MMHSGIVDRLRGGGTILCVGAHADDLEIGCGGTIRGILDGTDTVRVFWVVVSATGIREREARSSAASLLSNARESEVRIGEFRDGYFPYLGGEIKDFFESLKSLHDPDLIFTHHRGDRHQDHRIVSELTWNTFRRHLILEYEIPKYDADLGSPNLFYSLSRSQLEKKQAHLMEHFYSQRAKPWFTEDTFSSLCRIRGLECHAPTGFAEAFYCRKLLL